MSTTYRKIKSNVVVGLCGVAVILALIPLAMILFYVISQDPCFLVLLAIVALGLIWTGFSYVMDKQSNPG